MTTQQRSQRAAWEYRKSQLRGKLGELRDERTMGETVTTAVGTDVLLRMRDDVKRGADNEVARTLAGAMIADALLGRLAVEGIVL